MSKPDLINFAKTLPTILVDAHIADDLPSLDRILSSERCINCSAIVGTRRFYYEPRWICIRGVDIRLPICEACYERLEFRNPDEQLREICRIALWKISVEPYDSLESVIDRWIANHFGDPRRNQWFQCYYSNCDERDNNKRRCRIFMISWEKMRDHCAYCRQYTEVSPWVECPICGNRHVVWKRRFCSQCQTEVNPPTT